MVSDGDQGNRWSGSSWSCDSRNIVGGPPGLMAEDSERRGPPGLTPEDSGRRGTESVNPDDCRVPPSVPEYMVPSGGNIAWESMPWDPQKWSRLSGARCVVWKIMDNEDGTWGLVLLVDYEERRANGTLFVGYDTFVVQMGPAPCGFKHLVEAR